MFTQKDIYNLQSAQSLFSWNDYEFEYACKYLLEESGRFTNIQVTRKGPKGGDGGIDLKMHSADGEIMCGQCKQWRYRQKGLMSTIRDLYGAMKLQAISKGLLVTTIPVTTYEKAQAEKLDIEIIDLPLLEQMILNIRKTHNREISFESSGEFSAMSLVKIIFVLGVLLLFLRFIQA